MLVPVTDHTAQALARIAEQYKQSTRLLGLLAALVDQIQEIDDAEWQLATERYLYTDVELGTITVYFQAVGVQLDVIGAILNESRGALTDAGYRLVLRAKVKLMRSSGTVEELIGIFHAMEATGTITIVQYFPAGFTLTIAHVLTTAEAVLYLRFLRLGRAGGVGGILLWQEAADADTLILSDAAAYPEFDTHTGLGDAIDPNAGGYLTGASY